ncbi:MepB family protein [Xenorhabdus sp. SGI246]|uniref:MepB family protein n=1 Tax=Xenorhabdus sp. SGI246 TaxID=3158263 RepID=UPI00349F390D
MSSFASDTDNFPDSFNEIYKHLLLAAGYHFSVTPYRENESHEYEAIRFGLSGKSILFRQAKITPRKVGYFVTLWKRPFPNAEIMPFEQKDKIDFCIIATYSESQKGIFLFDSDILTRQGIFSTRNKEGKRAIRVYPSWIYPDSKQAIKTQKWQSSYFINLESQLLSIEKFNKIFSI